MHQNKYIVAIITTVLMFVQQTKAQDYKRAIGVHYGTHIGVNYKYFLNDEEAIVAKLSYYDRG